MIINNPVRRNDKNAPSADWSTRTFTRTLIVLLRYNSIQLVLTTHTRRRGERVSSVTHPQTETGSGSSMKKVSPTYVSYYVPPLG